MHIRVFGTFAVWDNLRIGRWYLFEKMFGFSFYTSTASWQRRYHQMCNATTAMGVLKPSRWNPCVKFFDFLWDRCHKCKWIYTSDSLSFFPICVYRYRLGLSFFSTTNPTTKEISLEPIAIHRLWCTCNLHVQSTLYNIFHLLSSDSILAYGFLVVIPTVYHSKSRRRIIPIFLRWGNKYSRFGNCSTARHIRH